MMTNAQARDASYARILADAIRTHDTIGALLMIKRSVDRVTNAPSIADLRDSNPAYVSHMATINAPQL